jgi:hypothetical protein
MTWLKTSLLRKDQRLVDEEIATLLDIDKKFSYSNVGHLTKREQVLMSQLKEARKQQIRIRYKMWRMLG